MVLLGLANADSTHHSSSHKELSTGSGSYTYKSNKAYSDKTHKKSSDENINAKVANKGD